MSHLLAVVLLVPLAILFGVAVAICSVRMCVGIGRARTVAEVDRAVFLNRLIVWPGFALVLFVAWLVSGAR